MNTYTDGFYEIEFQRLYKMQGQILRQIKFREKQQICYDKKSAELAERKVYSESLERRIQLTANRLARLNTLSAQLEADKEENSINNPANAQRAADAKIIADAYERAYAHVPTTTPGTEFGFWARISRFVAMRQK